MSVNRYKNLLNNRECMYALLLMDFDNDFPNRKQKFDEILLGQACKERVFILGINHKEAESLKKTLDISNNESIGEQLVKDCPDELADIWKNKHLRCNMPEIARMKKHKLFDWLITR